MMVKLARPKKNVTIEVRIPDQTKTAFMAACKRRNRTASDAIRDFIDAEVDMVLPWTGPKSIMRTVAGVVIGIIIGAGAAAPSLAHSQASSRAAFEQLDSNHDGVLTYTEYARR